MAYLMQIAIAVDQIGNTFLGGWADETISSRAWRQRHKRRWAAAKTVIDALFFLQKDHCRLAYEGERSRRQLPPELRTQQTAGAPKNA